MLMLMLMIVMVITIMMTIIMIGNNSFMMMNVPKSNSEEEHVEANCNDVEWQAHQRKVLGDAIRTR